MGKLDLNNLRKMIQNEVMSMVGEDMLLDKPDLGEPYYISRPSVPMDDLGYHDDYEDDDEGCPDEDDYEMLAMISEDCGCGGKKPDMDDHLLDKVDSMLNMGTHKKHSTKNGAYMSKTQLYKIGKYADKLYSMIPDHYNLEDWMRSKLSEIADDIGEVYHALDHRKYKGEL